MLAGCGEAVRGWVTAWGGGGYRTWGTGHLREKHGMGIEAERTSDTVAWTCRHKKGGSSLSSISSLAVWFFFLN